MERPRCACNHCTLFALDCSKAGNPEDPCEPYCASCITGECTAKETCPGYHTNYPGEYDWECPIHSKLKFIQTSGIKFASVNLGSAELCTGIGVDTDKLAGLETLLKSNYEIDILGVIGTGIKKATQMHLNSLDIQGYDVFLPQNGPDEYDGDGGIVLYVKSNTFEVDHINYEDTDFVFSALNDLFQSECFVFKPVKEEHAQLLQVFMLVIIQTRSKLEHVSNELTGFLSSLIGVSNVPTIAIGGFYCDIEIPKTKKIRFPWTPKEEEPYFGMEIQPLTFKPERKKLKTKKMVRLGDVILTGLLKNEYCSSGSIHQNLLPFKTNHRLVYMVLNDFDLKPEEDRSKVTSDCFGCNLKNLTKILLGTDTNGPCSKLSHFQYHLNTQKSRVLRIGYVRRWHAEAELENLEELGNKIFWNDMFDIFVINTHKENEDTKTMIEIPKKFKIIKKNIFLVYANYKNSNVSFEFPNIKMGAHEYETGYQLIHTELEKAKDGLLFTEISHPHNVDFLVWDEPNELKVVGEMKYKLNKSGFKPFGLPELVGMGKYSEKKIVYTMFAQNPTKYGNYGIIPAPMDHVNLLPPNRGPIVYTTRKLNFDHRFRDRFRSVNVNIFVSKHDSVLLTFDEIPANPVKNSVQKSNI